MTKSTHETYVITSPKFLNIQNLYCYHHEIQTKRYLFKRSKDPDQTAPVSTVCQGLSVQKSRIITVNLEAIKLYRHNLSRKVKFWFDVCFTVCRVTHFRLF